MPGARADQRAQSYPIPSAAATPSLRQRLDQRIRESGPLRFHDYMAMALYEPNLGYYAKGTRQVGKAGDFFTSVSVGQLYGHLLAQRFLAEWQKLGQPTRWRITECGAHDGTLAKDILSSLAELNPQALHGLKYAIPEPLDSLREAQKQTLKPYSNIVRHLSNAAILDALPGIIFGNEVLDALPFHVVECQRQQWQECRVKIDDLEALDWKLCPIDDPGLIAALAPIGSDFADGYRTEVRTNFPDFLHPLAQSLSAGSMIWIDYGFQRDDYYHPGRRCGTLRTFDQHRAGENPFECPGDTDITAHVDFSAVAEAATALGGCPAPLTSQGSWLTQVAREWLLGQEGTADAKLLRQFQTLTHPAQLGRSFQVMEIHWNDAG